MIMTDRSEFEFIIRRVTWKHCQSSCSQGFP